MQWQDIAISVAQWVSIIALIPSILGKDKPALSSSLLTAACMAVYISAYVSFGLWVSVASAALLFITWLILAWQKWRASRVIK